MKKAIKIGLVILVLGGAVSISITFYNTVLKQNYTTIDTSIDNQE